MKITEFEKHLEKTEASKESRLKIWITAMRLRTLPLSLSGLALGASFAVLAEQFSGLICLLSLICGVLLQILSNLANDYGDGQKGTDGVDRLGPARMVSKGLISQETMLKAIKFTIILIIIFVILLLLTSFGTNPLPWIIFGVLGLASIVAAIKYTMGKNPYGYSGKGDFFVFVFFGPVTVLGSYYLYGSNFFYAPIFPAISAGLFSMAVLNVNNIRDMKSDALHNKITFALKLGEKVARQYHLLLVSCGFLLWAAYLGIMFGALTMFLILLGLPVMKAAHVVYNSYEADVLDKQLKITALGTGFFQIVLAFILPWL